MKSKYGYKPGQKVKCEWNRIIYDCVLIRMYRMNDYNGTDEKHLNTVMWECKLYHPKGGNTFEIEKLSEGFFIKIGEETPVKNNPSWL